MATRKARKGDTSKAIAYLRVSTDRQELGPEAQRAAVEAWAKSNGVAIVGWHEDRGVSGATELDGRPGLMAALAALRAAGVGILAVAKRDRIARDIVIASTIDRAAESAGARVVSAAGEGTEGNDPNAQLLRGVADLFSQHERAMIRARTRAALAAKRAKGERTGTVRYGFTLASDGVSLIPCEQEQNVIARVREHKERGLSYREIVAALESEGITSRTGKPLAVTQVGNILRAA